VREGSTSSSLLPVLLSVPVLPLRRAPFPSALLHLSSSSIFALLDYRFFWPPRSPSHSTKADIESNLSVNLYGSINTVAAFLPLVRKSKTKKLGFVSSSLGSISFSGDNTLYTAYSVSKAALNMYGKKLSKELEEEGFTVFLVRFLPFSSFPFSPLLALTLSPAPPDVPRLRRYGDQRTRGSPYGRGSFRRCVSLPPFLLSSLKLTMLDLYSLKNIFTGDVKNGEFVAHDGKRLGW
jgi:NAD(P)-dependent dehydrogenase (short-subunit alcohol dehydrogenase family)